MNDPYVYKNGVLKNKLGIMDHKKLKAAEAGVCFTKLINVDSIEHDSFDMSLFQKIHQHIFEDIFDWAGQFRKVPMEKSEDVLNGWSVDYSQYKNISQDLSKRLDVIDSFDWKSMPLKDLAYQFARQMALLWRIHPYRDGNTRTTLCFAFLYAKEHGFPLDMVTFTNELNREMGDDNMILKHCIRDKFVVACLDDRDAPQIGPLASVFYRSMMNYQKEKGNCK